MTSNYLFCGYCKECFPKEKFSFCDICDKSYEDNRFNVVSGAYICTECMDNDRSYLVEVHGKLYKIHCHGDCLSFFKMWTLGDKFKRIEELNLIPLPLPFPIEDSDDDTSTDNSVENEDYYYEEEYELIKEGMKNMLNLMKHIYKKYNRTLD